MDSEMTPAPLTLDQPAALAAARLLPAPVIEVLSAEKVFADGTRALQPVDLTLRAGDFMTLIGPSGCGKSTLLGMMSNLLQPSEGRLSWWRGGPEKIGAKGRQIGIVFQDPTLMPWATVESNVRLLFDLDRVPASESTPRVRDALDRVGLTKFAKHYPRQLSGGMRMRVAIARALATDPDVLLMDEPFGALDEFTRHKLDADILDMWQERSLTAVFVTHSIYEAVFLSTRIIVMAASPGRIIDEIIVDEPFPRDESFRVSTRFAKLCADVLNALSNAQQPNHGAP
jgi:NitT/TauT family transport system ATP-binding protein